MEEPQGVAEMEDNTELHELQQQLQQAKDTVAQLQAQQRKDKSDFHKMLLLLFLLVPVLLAMLLPITMYLVGCGPLSGHVVTDSHPGTSKFD